MFKGKIRLFTLSGDLLLEQPVEATNSKEVYYMYSTKEKNDSNLDEELDKDLRQHVQDACIAAVQQLFR